MLVLTRAPAVVFTKEEGFRGFVRFCSNTTQVRSLVSGSAAGFVNLHNSLMSYGVGRVEIVIAKNFTFFEEVLETKGKIRGSRHNFSEDLS